MQFLYCENASFLQKHSINSYRTASSSYDNMNDEYGREAADNRSMTAPISVCQQHSLFMSSIIGLP